MSIETSRQLVIDALNTVVEKGYRRIGKVSAIKNEPWGLVVIWSDHRYQNMETYIGDIIKDEEFVELFKYFPISTETFYDALNALVKEELV